LESQNSSDRSVIIAQAESTLVNEFVVRGKTRLEQGDYQGAINDLSAAMAMTRSLAMADLCRLSKEQANASMKRFPEGASPNSFRGFSVRIWHEAISQKIQKVHKNHSVNLISQ
jgi:hypothetical protein